ncbi:hypothetical protein SAMN05880561_105198 [Rhizobium sp. RU33A]|uniref:hypothetical protein n=1 Tax=Rhizobium sp. RU33A TaxID=1907413 RepID=UPI000954C738|nr:hypothetical protein [Rhizobium sp. RU33A]SIQ87631.1 hypothetical protein SAMN05880561_105198 [Rhizobium sp. RU33A]
MDDHAHVFPAIDRALESITSYQEVCRALEADFLSPTGKVAVVVDVYIEAVMANSSASDETAQAAYDVRRALREYQNARKSTVFGLGVSDRTKAAKEGLSESLSRLQALSSICASDG